MNYDFFIRAPISIDLIADAISHIYSVNVLQVSSLDETSDDTIVRFEHYPKSGGFRTYVSIYVPDNIDKFSSSKELGLLLSSHFQCDVLTSPDEIQDPYRWLLIRPDGGCFLVDQRTEEEENDVMEIDENNLERVS